MFITYYIINNLKTSKMDETKTSAIGAQQELIGGNLPELDGVIDNTTTTGDKNGKSDSANNLAPETKTESFGYGDFLDRELSDYFASSEFLEIFNEIVKDATTKFIDYYKKEEKKDKTAYINEFADYLSVSKAIKVYGNMAVLAAKQTAKEKEQERKIIKLSKKHGMSIEATRELIEDFLSKK